MSADFTRRRPAFWRSKDDHGPSRSEGFTRVSSLFLISLDFVDTLLERGSHGLVHRVKVGSFDKVWGPAVSQEQVFELFMGYSSEDGRVVDFVPGVC